MDTLWDDDLQDAQFEATKLRQSLNKALSESNTSNSKRHEASIRSNLALFSKKLADLEGLVRETDNPDFNKLNQLNELYTIKTEAETYLKKYSPMPTQPDYSKDIMTMDNEDILASRHALLVDQDVQLNSLDGSVTNIRNYSANIRDEVSLHSRLLQGTNEDMDNVQSRIERNYRLFSNVVRRSSTKWLYFTIFVLTIILFLLIFL